MLKTRKPQLTAYDRYLYEKIVPADHLLRRINQVVDLSFAFETLKDRYTEDFGRPAADSEFMLRLCLLQYLNGFQIVGANGSDRVQCSGQAYSLYRKKHPADR